MEDLKQIYEYKINSLLHNKGENRAEINSESNPHGTKMRAIRSPTGKTKEWQK